MFKIPVIFMFLSISFPACADLLDSEDVARIIEIGTRAGVPPSVTAALMHEESRGDPRAESRTTSEGFKSRGLFQLYEKFETELVRKFFPYARSTFNIWNPYDNAEVALRYLEALHSRFGNWYEALVYYNCGRINGAPEASRAYARRIVNYHE
jgi:soluble lytic murein transglycosylase-like protein